MKKFQSFEVLEGGVGEAHIDTATYPSNSL